MTRYENCIIIQNADTATVLQKLRIWQEFVTLHKRLSPERTEANKIISEIINLMSNSAAVNSEDKFVTCKSVKERIPQGITNRFSSGSVYAWAQVRSPRNERVTFKWYLKGRLFDSASYDIQSNMGEGYRIWHAKHYRTEERGKNEVRLYNSQNQLIGRRVFYVR